jgi:NAD(P)-dependent dehydrogenase (short-subunit alcohol dehydrogenase family)
MKKTVLITGTSSGIGKATVLEFAKMGWNVIATQRTHENETDFNMFSNVKIYSLDVTNLESIKHTISQAQKDFGKIDVVVNNAGYGVDGAFEAMSDEIIEKQFNTNVFGLMRVTREAIKHMRPNGGGTIIQISSMGGKITFPLYSIYHATKFAVEGFTESLQYELSQVQLSLVFMEEVDNLLNRMIQINMMYLFKNLMMRLKK